MKFNKFNKVKVLKWGGGSVAAVIILVAVTIALLPLMVRYGFQSWAEDHGLTGSISEVDISLTDGQLRLTDINLLDAQNKGLQIGEVFVQVHLRDLWHRRVTIEDVQITTLNIDANRTAAGELTIAGLKQQTGTEETEKAAEPWQITLAPTRLRAVRFCMDSAKTTAHEAYATCANLQSLIWQGSLQLTTGTAATTSTLSIDGDLQLAGVTVDDMLRTRRMLEIRDLRLSGNATTAPTLNINGDLQLAGVSVDDTLHARNLLQADALDLSGITVKGTSDVSIMQIRGSGFRALQRSAEAADDYLLAWQELGISGAKLQGSDIQLAEVALEGVAASLYRDRQGTFELQKYLSVYQQQSRVAELPDVAAEPSKRPDVMIGKISLVGDNRLQFHDEAVSPVFKQTISNIALDTGAIDSSAQTQPTDFALGMQVGEFGKIDINGTVTLFAERPTLNVKGKVLALNIGDMSAYAREFLQHKIKSGQLDADLDIKIDQGKLDSNAALTLHKFYVEPLKAEEKDPYKQDLGVPLTTALSLLREKDDRIAITLPVSGDITAPDFALNNAINKVMVKAIKTTVLTYYSPFGLISLAKGAINLATALRFEPVVFAPNSAQLEDSGKEQLQAMSRMLNERPGIHLVLCGQASLADEHAMFPPKPARQEENGEENGNSRKAAKPPVLTEQQKEALIGLATQRGEAVKRYLVNEHGIGADRLIQCNPEYVENDERKPRVDISI
jgi:outer membrane protein OmpA-like peptidoglycan-associated protein